jgi:hypothetical protein
MENRAESRAMTPALFDALRHITTGTVTTILLKKGIRRCWMSGPKPLAGADRIVGPAFTRGREGRQASRSLSDERGDQSALRGMEETKLTRG